MSTRYVTRAIVEAIQSDGFSVKLATPNKDGLSRHGVVATDLASGERFCVTAPTMYEAAFELANALGWEFD